MYNIILYILVEGLGELLGSAPAVEHLVFLMDSMAGMVSLTYINVEIRGAHVT